MGKNGGDDNEIIEVIEVPLKNAQEFLRDQQLQGTLVDLKVFGLVELARKMLDKGLLQHQDHRDKPDAADPFLQPAITMIPAACCFPVFSSRPSSLVPSSPRSACQPSGRPDVKDIEALK